MVAFCIGILLLIPLVDLGIKYFVEKQFSVNEEIPLGTTKIRIRHVKNEGMALNLLDRHPTVVRWISILMIVPISIYYVFLLLEKGRGLEKISYSLLLGGAISNLYDRIVRKHVVDYIGFSAKREKLQNITYNIGDFGIFAGAIGLVFASLFSKK